MSHITATSKSAQPASVSELGSCVRNRARDRVEARVWNHVGYRVWDRVGDRVRKRVWSHVWDRVDSRVGAAIANKVREVTNAVR